MRFWKMNGAGNDFVIINNFEEKISEDKFSDIAKIVCERHMSVGADGLMVVDKPSSGIDADYRMHFYNSDGSTAEMCGNGARCICRFGIENGLAKGDPVIETTAGIVTGQRLTDSLYRIKLNNPSVIELERSFTIDERFDFWKAVAAEKGIVNILPPDKSFNVTASHIVLGDPGIPHLVAEYKGVIKALCGSVHLKDADTDILRELGRALRFNSALENGANVNFVEVIGKDQVYERTFERGVEDFTYACGTGTGCAAAALTLLGKVSGENVQITVTGGDLFVTIEEIDELMPANVVGDTYAAEYKNTENSIHASDAFSSSEDPCRGEMLSSGKSDICGESDTYEKSDTTIAASHVYIHGLYLTGPTNVVVKGELTDEALVKLLNGSGC